MYRFLPQNYRLVKFWGGVFYRARSTDAARGRGATWFSFKGATRHRGWRGSTRRRIRRGSGVRDCRSAHETEYESRHHGPHTSAHMRFITRYFEVVLCFCVGYIDDGEGHDVGGGWSNTVWTNRVSTSDFVWKAEIFDHGLQVVEHYTASDGLRRIAVQRALVKIRATEHWATNNERELGHRTTGNERVSGHRATNDQSESGNRATGHEQKLGHWATRRWKIGAGRRASREAPSGSWRAYRFSGDHRLNAILAGDSRLAAKLPVKASKHSYWGNLVRCLT